MANPVKATKQMFDQCLSKANPDSMQDYDPRAKDRKAQAAGREGGLIGGRARAKRLSASKKRILAKKARKDDQ